MFHVSYKTGPSGFVLCTLFRELGNADRIRKKFRSAEAFASWLCLCPDNWICQRRGAALRAEAPPSGCLGPPGCGARVLKCRTRKVANRIANDLRMAANALRRAKGPFADYVRRFKGRLGKAEGIVAGAHKLARIIWAMIVHRLPYDETTAFKSTPASSSRRLKHLQNQAASLSMKLVPA